MGNLSSNLSSNSSDSHKNVAALPQASSKLANQIRVGSFRGVINETGAKTACSETEAELNLKGQYKINKKLF